MTVSDNSMLLLGLFAVTCIVGWIWTDCHNRPLPLSIRWIISLIVVVFVASTMILQAITQL